jgi:Short C-terminal domain
LRGKAQGEIRKIERLQKLRESGALTDAEFQREKAKILSEG